MQIKHFPIHWSEFVHHLVETVVLLGRDILWQFRKFKRKVFLHLVTLLVPCPFRVECIRQDTLKPRLNILV